MPSLSMMARYRSGARDRRYSRRPRRLPISISNPRREWWSFVCCLKWSVRLLIRSVRSAICTSGEPVSPSWVRNCSIRFFFRSTASGIEGPQSPRPREPCSHAGAGSKSSFFVRRYARRVPRGATEVKLTGGSGVCARRGDVERDLLPQGVDAGKLPLLPEAAEEGQGHSLVVEITREIEDMSLYRKLSLSERRPEPDVDDGLVLTGRDREPADVDPNRKPQGTVGLDVGRGKAEGSATPGSADHLTPDRIGTTEEPCCARKVSPLERRPDLRR